MLKSTMFSQQTHFEIKIFAKNVDASFYNSSSYKEKKYFLCCGGGWLTEQQINLQALAKLGMSPTHTHTCIYLQ